MNLYKIADEYKALLDMIEAGEIPEEAIEDTLASVEGEFTDKVDNIACYIKSLVAEAEAIKAEVKKQSERATAKLNKVERLSEYLQTQMLALDKQKLETARSVVTIKKNPPSVSVVDVELLASFHPDLLTYKAPEPNKTAIKALLKDGVEVKGCELVSKQSINIR